ncbi:MAG TPA: DUF805 domain-containing protein [Afipia sp.]
MRGRIGRGTFWLAQFIWGMVFILFISVGMWVAERAMTATQDRTFYAVVIPIVAALAYATCAIAVKRFHDRDKSGWWVVPLILIPAPPTDIIERIAGKPFGMVWGILSGVILFWAAFEFGCLAGTAGTNRFGEAPAPSKAWGEQ